MPPSGYGIDSPDGGQDTEGSSDGRSLEIHLRGYELTIRKEDAAKIEVMDI